MYYSKQKSVEECKLYQLFPRLNPLENKLHFRSRFATSSPVSTPKNIKPRNGFDQSEYSTSRQNQETQPNYHRGTDKFKIHRKSRYKGTFEYESISGKSSSLLITKDAASKSSKMKTDPFPDTFEMYNSIQSNLSECDRILLKLKNTIFNGRESANPLKKHTRIQQNRLDYKECHSEKKQYAETYKQPAVKSALIKITAPPLQESLYPDPPTLNLKALPSQPMISPPPQAKFRTIGAQKIDPIVQIRRRRIHQIIKNRKDSADSHLETSLIRLRVRGQQMFSKMARTREKPMDQADTHLQQQLY